MQLAAVALMSTLAPTAIAANEDHGATEPDAPTARKTGKLSLVDAAPPLLSQQMRYPKYYGDAHLDRDTVDGSVLDRQYLLGSVGGLRDKMVEHGVYFDMGVTQVLQGVAAGDSDDDANYVGSADAWLGLDSGRLGLWPGGLVFAHLEGNWGDAVDGSGALLPLNADSIMPDTPPDSIALSELYLTQALSENTLIFLGKADWASFVDTTFFANNERTQFLNEGLVNNPLLGSFVPYTSLGAVALFQTTERLALGAAALQNASKATQAGFDDLEIEKATFAFVGNYSSDFFELPGSYQFLLGYTTRDAVDFAIDRRYLIEEILGLVPVKEEDGNYAFAFTASQYLWASKSAEHPRHDGNPTGLGLFFRFGIAPEDRNVLDQFYSVGIGGYGGPCGRANDGWGIGWAGSHISDDVRSLADDVAIDLHGFEHVIEAYYSLALTPAVSLSLDVQHVLPVAEEAKNLTLVGTRLQIDF